MSKHRRCSTIKKPPLLNKRHLNKPSQLVSVRAVKELWQKVVVFAPLMVAESGAVAKTATSTRNGA